VQGTSYIANPLRRVLVPRVGQKTVVHLLGDRPNQFSIYSAAHSFGQHQPDFLAVDIRYASFLLINLTLIEGCQRDAVPLYLQFKYEPSHPHAPIHEIMEGHNKRIKEFYWRLWFSDDEKRQDLDVHDIFTGTEVTISANEVEGFCAVVGSQQEKTPRSSRLSALMRSRRPWTTLSSLAGRQS
jgi:fatty acid synthase subunit beta